jgi:septal ring factor EnvC (AmiA/AmiB activator)
LLQAKEDINKKITQTSSKLDSFSKDYSTVSKKMAATAKAIIEQKKEILNQQEFIKSLQEELFEKENNYKGNTVELQEMKKRQKKLKEEQDNIEHELVFVIAKSASLSIVLEEKYTASPESIIEFEVLNKMFKGSKEKANVLNQQFFANSKNIDQLNEQTSSLEVSIANIDKKRKDMVNTQKANKEALEKLEVAKASYKLELKKLLEKQDALKKTLEQLNLVKIDEIKKASQKEERRIAFDSKQPPPDENLLKVKKHGSSFQEVQTKNYTGEKTIAPLDSYTILKKYGTYTDPIYGIKIFNESISLKPKGGDAKVKTVLNGKVIYADKTAVLDNIVIVEHEDGLHTIYANLTQISPDIVKGKKIKKGYTIGRVSDELIFEVTQRTFHINPINLFQ